MPAPLVDRGAARHFALASFASCLLASCAHALLTGPLVVPGPARVALRPGVEYVETVCATGDGPVRLRALHLRPRTSAQFRALPNPTAHRDSRCLQRYGGADLRSLTVGVPGFRVLGAANGNFFHERPSGFRSNGMIWSAEGAAGGRLLAPMQPTVDLDYRGDRVLVVDGAGGHELRVATGPCVPGACRSTVVATRFVDEPARAVLDRHRGPLDDAELVAVVREAFPSTTLAMQLTPAYEEAPAGADAATLSEYVRCVPRHPWTCDPHPVTLLCVRPGAVSVITAESTRYAGLATALAPRGACETGCEALYLLDGGGSAQVGYVDPDGHNFIVRYAGKADRQPPAGCATYRPVDHYLAIGVADSR